MLKNTLKLTLISSVVLLGGCGANENSQSQNVEKENKKQTVSSSEVKTVYGIAESTKNFKSIKEIKKAAQLSIEGKVLEQKTIVHGEVPFTISKIEVLDSFKGKIKKNDVITIIETGGRYTPEGKNGEDLPEVDFQINEGTTVKTGEQYYLFLESFVGPQVEGAYIPLAIHQGKIKINKETNKVEKVGTEPLDDFSEESVDTFKNKVKAVE